MRRGLFRHLVYFTFIVHFSFQCFGAGLAGLNADFIAELRRNPILDWEYLKALTPGELADADAILKSFEGRGEAAEQPWLVLTAGAMASGKTTVLNHFKTLGRLNTNKFLIIDPDDAKKALMAKYRSSVPDGTKSPSDFHLLSIYISDMTLVWAMKQNIPCVYVTSLRHLPSAQNLIRTVRRDFPSFKLELLHVRSPLASLDQRNRLRAQTETRLVPHDLLMAASTQVRETVRHVRASVDSFIRVVNDDDRSPVILEKPDIGPETIHILLDWDWTSAYWMLNFEPTLEQLQDPDLIHVDGHYYRLTDGLREFVAVLSQTEDVLLSLDSGGSQLRNEEALRKVLIPSGKDGKTANLFEVVYDILSYEDLKILPTEQDPKKQKKKAIDQLGRHINPEQVLRVDDFMGMIWPGEEKHVVFLGRTFKFHQRWSKDMTGSAPISRHYDPDSEMAWALESNKLAFALGIILESIRVARAERISIREAYQYTGFDTEGRRIDREDPRMFRFYEIGGEAMRRINPNWQRVPFPFETSCRSDLSRIITTAASTSSMK